ncbi:nitroreductase family protein [Chloroflexota bacterium]
MDVFDAIKNRRSIRVFKSTPVDAKSLDTILEAGRLAPSWGNTQTWRFIVIQDSVVKTQLADNATSPDSRNNRVLKQAPIVIAACAELNRAGWREGKPTTDKEGYWFMFDAGLALENMVLEAQELGIGTLYIGAFDAKKAASVLDVPEGYSCVILLPLGYPDEQPEAKPRKEISEIIFKNKFGVT